MTKHFCDYCKKEIKEDDINKLILVSKTQNFFLPMGSGQPQQKNQLKTQEKLLCSKCANKVWSNIK